MDVIEIPELEAPAAEALAVPKRRIPTRRLFVGVGLCTVGVFLAIAAGWIITGPTGSTRGAIALFGGFLVWRGMQVLGELRYGRDFRLGLWTALFWLALISFCAIFADFLPIEDWHKADLSKEGIRMRPGLRWPEFLGRTEKGYSELSHVIYGARTSLMIGLVAVAAGLFIGAVIGLLAGWYGKAFDAGTSVATNVILAFPPLILLLTVVTVYGRGQVTIALALALVSIPTYVRLMRAQTLAVRQREFVLASRALGAKDGRVMWREILPNAVLPVASYSFLVIAVVIVAEASLSYLGVGVPPPTPSWGGMIVRGQSDLDTAPHLVLVPATVMFLTVLSLNRIGDHVRKNVFNKSESR